MQIYLSVSNFGLTSVPGTVLSRIKAIIVPARLGFPRIICMTWSNCTLPEIMEETVSFRNFKNSYNILSQEKKYMHLCKEMYTQ